MCVKGRPETQIRKPELLGRDLGGGASTEETRANAKALGQGQTLQVPRPGLPGLMGRETVETQRELRPHKVRQKPVSGLWPLPHHLTLACANGPSVTQGPGLWASASGRFRRGAGRGLGAHPAPQSPEPEDQLE